MLTTTRPGHSNVHRRSWRPRTLALALLLSAIALTLNAPVGAAHATGTCPATKKFVVGGVGDTRSAWVPGTSGATRIEYSASLAPIGFVPGDASAAQGAAALNSAARGFRKRCPDSAIHVTGYSLGALVAGNVRDSWTHDAKMRNYTSFTLIADPRAEQGAMAQLPSLIPGFTHTGPRPASSIPTSSICRSAADFICFVGNPAENPLPLINGLLGYAFGDHTYRSGEVTDEPGAHDVAGPTRIGAPGEVATVLPLPLPVEVALAVLPSPAEVEPVLALAQDVARDVAPGIVPPAELSLTRYIPTPLRDYLPPPLADAVPEQIGDVVLPALPALPSAPSPQPRSEPVTAASSTVLRALRTALTQQ